MRSVRRLSFVALTSILAAVGLAAGDRATALVAAPPSVAAPLAPRETPITTRTAPASPRLDPDQSSGEQGRVERAKTFAWFLLLVKEHRGAR